MPFRLQPSDSSSSWWQVALPEGHEEADALDALQVAAQGLELLVVEEVHVLLADLVEDVLALDRHRRGLDPPALVERLLVFDLDAVFVDPFPVPRLDRQSFGVGGSPFPVFRDPIGPLRGDLADVDLGVEVGGEGIPVVAAVAVEDVERADLVEVVLLRVSGEHLGDAGVEAAAENRREAGLLEPLAVRPLPGILEVRLVRRLVVRRVQIAHARREARVHDREVLVGQRDVHDEVGLEILDHRRRRRDVHRVELRGRDLRGVRLRLRPSALSAGDALRNVVPDGAAARLRARRDEEFAECPGVLAHLRRRDARDAACADEHDLLSHVTAPFHKGLDR